jgi:hypothetical protein
MTKPIKKAGFNQGIYEQSASAKEMLGTIRWTQDGRAFRYAKASEALTPGKMTHATQLNAAHIDEAITAAVALNSYTLDLTVTAGKAIAEDELRGGYFDVRDEDGEGQCLLIAGNTAISVSGTSIQVALEDPIKIALTTDSEFDLVRSPWFDVALSTTDENFATGIPLINVTANYYCWVQTHGVANALIAGTPAVGSSLILSGTEGALAVIAADVDVDVPIVGTIWGAAGVAGEYGPVFLQID